MFLFMNPANEETGKFMSVMVLTVPVMGIVMNSVTNSTVSSISMEGKNCSQMLS